jgi:hypothetical protein
MAVYTRRTKVAEIICTESEQERANGLACEFLFGITCIGSNVKVLTFDQFQQLSKTC